MGTNLGTYAVSSSSILIDSRRYVEKSDFVVVVAPGCLHADRRDPDTKLRTKTCYVRIEIVDGVSLRSLRRIFQETSTFPTLLITSKEGTPEWVSTLDTLSLLWVPVTLLVVNVIIFLEIRVVPCDRGITREILEGMIEAKVQHYFKLEQTLEARLCMCLTNWWLRGDSVQRRVTQRTRHRFKQSSWDEKKMVEWVDEDGVPILFYAVLQMN